jgi:hypothetical protein
VILSDVSKPGWEYYRIERRGWLEAMEISRRYMSHRDIQFWQIDNALLAQIVTLAKIPPIAQAAIRQLATDMSYEISQELLHYQLREHQRRGGYVQARLDSAWRRRRMLNMKRLNRLSRELSACLENDDVTILAIACRNRNYDFPGWQNYDLSPLKKVIANLADASSRALSRLKKTKGKRGRPVRTEQLYTHGHGSFDGFVLRLQWDVQCAGGRLTLSKNTGTGTLKKVLELLRPHLPPKFIPTHLSPSRLARLRQIGTKK